MKCPGLRDSLALFSSLLSVIVTVGNLDIFSTLGAITSASLVMKPFARSFSQGLMVQHKRGRGKVSFDKPS